MNAEEPSRQGEAAWWLRWDRRFCAFLDALDAFGCMASMGVDGKRWGRGRGASWIAAAEDGLNMGTPFRLDVMLTYTV